MTVERRPRGQEVPAEGRGLPDPDPLRPDPEAVAEAWAARVRQNREQVDRVREVPDGHDFYGPVTTMFVADPRRTDEPLLDRMRELARPDERWLDIGSGAGRYALPLALRAREVVAVEPSAGMVAALREGMDRHGIPNIRIVEGGWPPEAPTTGARIVDPPTADVALIAHVGYDIEPIGAFLDAMEAAATRLCVAVLMERQPSTMAHPFWPIVHGEERIPLPALREFLVLLLARNRSFEVSIFDHPSRSFESEDDLAGFIRRQLWVAEGGAKDQRFMHALRQRIVRTADGIGLAGQPALPVGLVTWQPH